MNKEDYLRTEIRDGYQVSVTRKKVWLCELEMATWFCNVCEKYGLSYFLIGGSAIGAVRHNGFIPWDDDLDIGMLRSDFDKFRKVSIKELPGNYKIEYGVLKNNVFSSLLRIRNNDTTGIIVDEYEQNAPGGGIFIELYPFDNVPTGIKRKVQLAKSSMLFLALNNWNRKENFSGIKRLIISGLKMFPIESVWRMYEKNNTKYSGTKTEYVDTVALPSYAKQGIHFYKKTDVQQTVSHSYEFTDLNIPKGNDTCLRQQYGDYMELPPLEKRGTHHDFIVFYDPDRSYLEYKDSEILKKYFNGDISVELL